MQAIVVRAFGAAPELEPDEVPEPTLGPGQALVAVAVDQRLPLPDDVSLLDAAAITLQGLAAHYLATEQVRIESGTTVLVHAAAGGTGRLVVQWTKHLGAPVIGTVSNEHEADAAGTIRPGLCALARRGHLRSYGRAAVHDLADAGD